MERDTQKTGLVNLLVLLALGVTGFATASHSHCLSGQMATVFLLIGVLTAAVSYFQMRLEERERLERMELEEMSRHTAGSAMFESAAEDSFPARRSREQFQRYFVPGFTVVLFVLESVAAYFLWGWLGPGRTALPVREPMLLLGVFGLSGLVLFLVGKYSAGLVRLERASYLGPGASSLLLGAYLYFLIAVVVMVLWGADLPWLDRVVAQVLCGLLMLLAVEMLVTLVLEVYRPRVKGQAVRPLYESRLIGLLSHPEGLVTTAAHALDYQFGFKVSETWFYRFMEKALAWLILAQLGLLLVSTCFVFVQAGEEALLERFGKPVSGREILGPGLHLKWPWPIDQAHRFQTRAVQVFHVGSHHKEGEHEERSTVLWTVSHTTDEFHFLVASRESGSGGSTNVVAGKKPPPVSLLAGSIPIHYRVEDLRAWAYGHADAPALLERLATREVIQFLVSADFQDTMAAGRGAAAEAVQRLIQTQADGHGLGVKILFVGLADFHPPVAVGESFERVVGARQKREADKLEAQAHAIRTNAQASAQVVRTRSRALAERQQVEATARAEAAFFTNQLAAFQASPTIYAQYAYLGTLAGGSAKARKIVVAATNVQGVIQLDLEEKIQPNLLDIQMPAGKTR